jgi:hypothetical protein
VRGFDEHPGEPEESRGDHRGDHKAGTTLMLAPTRLFDHALLRVGPGRPLRGVVLGSGS